MLHQWSTTRLLLSPDDIGHSNALTIILAWVCFNSVRKCACVTQWSTNWLKCLQMTLAIIMLKNIFVSLAHYCVNTWHISLVCSITSSPCILKQKLIVSSIPMWYAKCHDANKTSPKKIYLQCNGHSIKGCKYSQVHNSITLHKFKRKWFKTLNYVKEKFIKIWKTQWSTKPTNLCCQKIISRRVFIFRRRCK